MPNTSIRLESISLAGIRKVFEKAKKLEDQGKNIIHMEIERPDFDTPKPIKDKAQEALDNGLVHYTSNYGIDELRETIAVKLKEENNININSSQVIITSGASMGLATAILGLVDIGDKVMIPSPAYPAYKKQVLLAGAEPVPVPLKIENQFKYKLEDLEELYSEDVKMLIINSPHNPTGSVLDRENLEMIADFAKEKDIFVVSDECYEKITFDEPHISIGSLPGMEEITRTVNSTSKSFSMTGWRVGFVAASQKVIDSIIKVPQNIAICPTSFAQYGAIKAFESKNTLTDDMIQVFKERREIIIDGLNKIPKLKFLAPKGALYVFPYVEDLGVSSQEFSDYLLEEAGVAVTPGDDFGFNGKGFVRFAYTCSTHELKLAMKRVEKSVKNFK